MKSSSRNQCLHDCLERVEHIPILSPSAAADVNYPSIGFPVLSADLRRFAQIPVARICVNLCKSVDDYKVVLSTSLAQATEAHSSLSNLTGQGFR